MNAIQQAARGSRLNAAADRQRQPSPFRPRPPLREHVANSVRRYLRDLDGSETQELYNIALREIEMPLFAEVLRHCDGNQSRAAGDARHPSRHAAQEAARYGLG